MMRIARQNEAARRWLLGSLGLLLLLPLACDTTSTPTVPPVTPPAATAGPGGQGQPCGTVEMSAASTQPRNEPAAQQAATCFWQAFQRCQPTTLVVRVMGVDDVTTHTFSLAQSGGRCVVQDLREHTIVPASLPNTSNRYTCADLVQKDGGLLFSACGDAGDIFIPASAPTQ